MVKSDQRKMASKPDAPRVRQKGDPVKCPGCGADAFCVNTFVTGDPRYPQFVGKRVRVRYYQCGACRARFKRVVPVVHGPAGL